MDKQKSVLMLIGSPKSKRSTSSSIADYLAVRLERAGLKTEVLKININMRTAEGRNLLLGSFDQADYILLISPLYVDSLPAPVIKFMELVAETDTKAPFNQSFIAMINAGFPEAAHNRVALAICRNFAGKVGLEWKGGLPIGMGGSISGAPLERLGGMVRKLTRALDLTVEAIVANKTLPEEAQLMAASPMMPHWFYRLAGNIGWNAQAKKNGVRARINDRS